MSLPARESGELSHKAGQLEAKAALPLPPLLCGAALWDSICFLVLAFPDCLRIQPLSHRLSLSCIDDWYLKSAIGILEVCTGERSG